MNAKKSNSLIRKVVALIFVSLVTHAVAQEFVSSEDRTRFQEVPYRKAEPGMLAPAAYVKLAKDAIQKKTNKIHFRMFSDGLVSHRFYRNAPPADRDIICVSFVYEGSVSGGGMINRGNMFLEPDHPVPVVMALIRKNLSKIYLNVANYKAG